MWFQKISKDLSFLDAMMDYYNKELSDARVEVQLKGNVEKNLAALPGVTEWRFTQLQEIEAILVYLNIQLKQIKQTNFKKYLETYNKALTSRDAERYAEGEKEVCDFEEAINEVALIRNKYLSIMKGLESKSYSLSAIAKLRAAGLEDISINE